MSVPPPWFMNVAVRPGTPAHEAAVRRRGGALAPGFRADPQADLQFFGGRTIADLTFVNVYGDGARAWNAADMAAIDAALAAAMADPGLNEIVQQYFPDAPVTTTMAPSRKLPQRVPAAVYKGTVEGWVLDLHGSGALRAFDLAATVVDVLLAPGAVLHTEETAAGVTRSADSLHGLGGYHGSVHPDASTAVYYAVGVYSERTGAGENGIVAFDAPWKNVVATFYHELQEARTDADVEDVNRTGNQTLLGWYAPGGSDGIAGEIGDTPLEEAGADLSKVMQEVPLADGSGSVPVQLMWSNAVHGPARPIRHRR
jgi:hypothetical protein